MARKSKTLRDRKRGGIASPFPFPTPTGGLDLRTDITQLAPTSARFFENLVSDGGVVSVRDGYTEVSEGIGSGSVDSMAVFEGASSRKLIACGNGEVYDASSSTASALTTASYTNSVWSMDNKNGYLFGVNAVDTPWRYNGSTVAATGFTGSGLTLANLKTIKNIRDRLWCTELNSADVWYGGIGSVTGTLTKFQLSQIASGGHCEMIVGWSRDAGDGADDSVVFIMNTGEVIIYTGDPGSTFELVGKYIIPEPIDRHSSLRVGGDTFVITRSGVVAISEAIKGIYDDTESSPVLGLIAPGIAVDAADFGDNEGWFSTINNGLAFINVPVFPGNSAKQYVLNTRNNTWSTFDLPAACMASFAGTMYFGAQTGGKVFSYSGTSDDGDAIIATSRQGFVVSPDGTNAHIALMRPHIVGDGLVQGYIQAEVDFDDRAFAGSLRTFLSAAGGSSWDTADWDTADWAGGSSAFQRWIVANGHGLAVSVALQLQSSAADVKWHRTYLTGIPAGWR